MDGEENIDSNILNAYRNALRKAWEDGRVSIEERTILQQFKGDLPIPEEILSLLLTIFIIDEVDNTSRNIVLL